MNELMISKYGNRITLDSVLDEAVTIAWIRTKSLDIVHQIYDLINGPKSYFTLDIRGGSMINDAWDIHKQYFSKKKPLSFTDCILIAYAKKQDILNIISFDDVFDAILGRIY